MNLLSRFYRHTMDKGMGRALRHRDYALFSLSSWISTVGFWIQRLAVGWLTWELTHSTAWLGAMALGHALPALFLAPFAGAVADRLDRLMLMRATQSGTIVLTGLLAWFVIADRITVEIMFVIIVADGIVIAFNMPARMTIAPALVPREDLTAAISVNSFLWQSSAFLGPALAGVIVAAWGLGPAFIVNALSFLPFYGVLFIIKLKNVDKRAKTGKSLFGDAWDGLSYCARHPGIGPIVLSAFLMSFLARPLTDLLPGFVGDIFQAGPAALGNLMSGLGVGGMIGSLWMANRNRIEGATLIYFGGMITLLLLTLLFAMNQSLMVAMAIMVGMGFAGSSAGNAAQTLIQYSVEGSHRARVLALLSLSHQAPALGAMLLGGLATMVGLGLSIGLGAGAGLLIVLWIARRLSVIAPALEHPAPAEEPSAQPAGPN